MLCNECQVIKGLDCLRTWAGRHSVFLVDLFSVPFVRVFIYIYLARPRTLMQISLLFECMWCPYFDACRLVQYGGFVCAAVGSL